MMILPAGVKVHLTLGTTDMRNCVDRMICARQRASFLRAGHQ